jgi:hypothetical protein
VFSGPPFENFGLRQIAPTEELRTNSREIAMPHWVRSDFGRLVRRPVVQDRFGFETVVRSKDSFFPGLLAGCQAFESQKCKPV